MHVGAAVILVSAVGAEELRHRDPHVKVAASGDVGGVVSIFKRKVHDTVAYNTASCVWGLGEQV